MPKPETEILPETKVTPDPALEKRTRRTFDVEYKVRILNEAAQCRRGEIGALLRREGLYSSQLNAWRREFEQQGHALDSDARPVAGADWIQYRYTAITVRAMENCLVLTTQQDHNQ